MNYRTKLAFALIFLAVISSSFALILEYGNIRSSIETLYMNRTVSVAHTLSVLLDSKDVEALNKDPQRNSGPYNTLENQLMQVLDSSAVANINIGSIFLLRPEKNTPTSFTTILDVRAKLDAASLQGKQWDLAKPIDLEDHLEAPYCPPTFFSDHSGIWLSGFAPIRSTDGTYLFTIGVTIYSSNLLSLLHQVIEYQVIGVLLSLILAAIGANFLVQNMDIPLQKVKVGIREMIQGNFSHRIKLYTHDEFFTLATSLNKMSKALSERKRLKKGFSHHLTHSVLGNLLKDAGPVRIIGGRRQVTLLFVRFKDFPKKIDLYEPEQFFELFNQTYRKFLSIVFRNQGSLEKFYSDQILVQFGMPLIDPHQEENALNAALEIKRQVDSINELFNLKEEKRLHVHIGIHTGEAIIGTIGSSFRKAYTTIGEAINTTTAIASRCAHDDFDILISETTANALKKNHPLKKAALLTEGPSQKSLPLYKLSDEI